MPVHEALQSRSTVCAISQKEPPPFRKVEALVRSDSGHNNKICMTQALWFEWTQVENVSKNGPETSRTSSKKSWMPFFHMQIEFKVWEEKKRKEKKKEKEKEEEKRKGKKKGRKEREKRRSIRTRLQRSLKTMVRIQLQPRERSKGTWRVVEGDRRAVDKTRREEISVKKS